MFTVVLRRLRTAIALVHAVVDRLLVRARLDQVALEPARVAAELNLVVTGLGQDPGPGPLDHAEP